MASDDQNPTNPEQKETLENPELEEFFHRLSSNFRWPKPSDEAITAAVEAIQRMAGGLAAAELAQDGRTQDSGIEDSSGLSGQPGFADPPPVPHARNGAVHHYHHHYHHFVSGAATGSSAPAPESENTAPRGRAPGAAGAAGGRAEMMARQVAQNWAQACNTKHLDDLLELYASDATLIRSNVPPVRSLPAVREFLHSVLEAGLGELEMESLRIEIMGEIAMDLGRCKMLVPVAMGKRREERGKYLLILVRQPAGTWKILTDFWSSDQTVSAALVPEPPRKVMESGTQVRKPR